MTDEDESRRGKLYTDLSKVVTYLSKSRNGFSLPAIRRWRAPDAIAFTAGGLLTVIVPIVTIKTGYAQHILVICFLLTVVSVFALGRLPKFGPSALTRLRWRLEAHAPRTTCTHALSTLLGRGVDPRTGRLVTRETDS